MMRRAKRRALLWFVAIGASVVAAIGCSDTLISNPAPCIGAGCTCEQDPQQPLCKGFNDRPEGGVLDMSDARPQDATDGSDGSVEPDGSLPTDGEADAPADGGDEAG